MGKSWKKEKSFIPRNEEWGRFKTSNHGQGPHRKKSRGEHWLAELLEEEDPETEEEDQEHRLSLEGFGLRPFTMTIQVFGSM